MNKQEFKVMFHHRFSGEVSLIQRLEDAGRGWPEPWRTLWAWAVKAFAVWLQDYKIAVEMKNIDEQTTMIADAWDRGRAEQMKTKVEELVKISDPEAKVSVVTEADTGLPGYLIEYKPNGSYAQSVLGGEMRIVYSPDALEP
jgi:hypothetical protein